MRSNLYKVEDILRSVAKRNKTVKYSLGLAILFLMMGTSAFSEEIDSLQDGAVPTKEEITSSRENLRDSVGNLQSKIEELKEENEKDLAGLRLELIQLMEQGNQVVKSPWASWQFGANYMYSKWNGTYKGRGDKAEKYPYEGVFTRSTSIFGRATTARTADQKAILASIIEKNGGFSPNGNGQNYGLINRALVPEDPMTIEVSAGIKPKNIQKSAITLSISPVDIPQPNPSPAAPEVSNTPAAPNINIPSFAPVAPKVEAPSLPVPPTFAVVVGSDCNPVCNSSSNTPRQNTKPGFNLAGRAAGNIDNILHYTWPVGTGSYKLPGERASLAFKMYTETRKNFTLGTDIPRQHTANYWGSATAAPTNVYFNSYNFGY